MMTLFSLLRSRPVTTAFAAGALLASGMTTGGCKKRLPNMISKSDEIQMGQQLAQETEKQYRVLDSGPEADRLARVAARLVPLARKDYDVPYSVKLLDSKEVNAFAAPGGPVYFYRGLASLMTSDDEMAAVLGHELTHVTRKHSAQQLSDAYLKEAGASILLGAANAGQIAQTAAGLLLNLEQLNYSRNDEDEADANGMKYMVSAGYSAQGMVAMLKKLQQAGGNGGGPEFLQNHPLTSKRIQKAEERAKQYRSTP